MSYAPLRWRLWRWLTNPRPFPGQMWRLDGVGLVRILSVEDDETFPVTLVHWTAVDADSAITWMGTFRRYADPAHLALSDRLE